MAERTIKIGSAGKIFSLTGWKVGWMVAAPELAARGRAGAPVPDLLDRAQSAGGGGVRAREGDAWLAPMRQRFARARDRMTDGLRAAGFAVLDAAATYFLCVDLAGSGIAEDDEAFARRGGRAGRRRGHSPVAVCRAGPAAPPRPAVLRQEDETIDAGIAAMAARPGNVRRLTLHSAAAHSGELLVRDHRTASDLGPSRFQPGECLGRQRLRDQIALADVAAELADQPQLLDRLDAFGRRGQAEAMGKVDDRLTISRQSRDRASVGE